MNWLDIVLSGVATVVNQWVTASVEERAAIEARAVAAVKDLVAASEETKAAHDVRTAETEAAIEKAKESA